MAVSGRGCVLGVSYGLLRKGPVCFTQWTVLVWVCMAILIKRGPAGPPDNHIMSPSAEPHAIADGAVAMTSLLDACIRGEEMDLFLDGYGTELAGDRGRELYRAQQASGGTMYIQTVAPLRVRFFDSFFQRCVRERAVEQVVILGAGLDVRPLRIPMCDAAPRLRVFEVDYPTVLAHKDETLERLEGVRYAPLVAARTGVELLSVPVNFDDESFDGRLCAATGFNATAKTAWLIEGVVHYLDSSAVQTTFRQCAALSGPGSLLAVDMMNRRSVELTQQGKIPQAGSGDAAFRFGDDAPKSFLARAGWRGPCDVRTLGDPDVNVDGRFEGIEGHQARGRADYFLVSVQRDGEDDSRARGSR